ncbi:MAG: hypothetical protein ACJ77A_07500 [Actinomycetota bacterium]
MAGWEWAALALGSASVVLGIATRLGHFRAGFMWYNVDSAAGSLKNRPFGAIPGGLGLILGTVGVLLEDHGSRGPGELLIFLGLALLVVGLWWILRRPPEWMKPAWLRAMERGAPVDPGRLGLVSGRRVSRLPIWAPVYWGMLVAIVAVLVLRAIFDWPFSLWVGVGMGMMQLAALHPTSREEVQRFYRRNPRESNGNPSAEAREGRASSVES